jgi:hypothetical protein
MAGSVAPNMVTDGLVLYLDASNTKSYVSGSTIWNDISTGGNNGSLTNGPTFSSTNGGSIVFDGTNDYIDCGNNNVLDFTNNFTLSVWLNRNSTQPSLDSGIVGRATAADGYSGYLLFYNGSGISLYIRSATRVSTGVISPNVNYNVVGTYNGSTAAIYVNGVLVNSSATNVVAVPTGVNFQIGQYTLPPPQQRNFAGSIFNTCAYNRALSATEVLQNYNATKGRYL